MPSARTRHGQLLSDIYGYTTCRCHLVAALHPIFKNCAWRPITIHQQPIPPYRKFEISKVSTWNNSGICFSLKCGNVSVSMEWGHACYFMVNQLMLDATQANLQYGATRPLYIIYFHRGLFADKILGTAKSLYIGVVLLMITRVAWSWPLTLCVFLFWR